MYQSVVTGIVALLSSVVGGLFVLLGARVNARSQERAANLRGQVDIQLQADRLRDAAASAELAIRRAKLEDLRIFLSEVAQQCSRTQATLDQLRDLGVEEHVGRWRTLAIRLHQARAAADIYFPNLSEGMAELGGCIEVFGWQAYVLLHAPSGDPIDGKGGEEILYRQIIAASDRTGGVVEKVGRAISEEAEHLSEMGLVRSVASPLNLRTTP
jgi:hypothetical protein